MIAKGRQCPPEPGQQRRRGLLGDQIVAVLEPETDVGRRGDHHGDRIVGVIEAALTDHVVQRRLFAFLVVGTEVLEHVEDVEEHRVPGLLLQPRQTDVVVRHHLDPLGLHPPQQLTDGLVGPQ